MGRSISERGASENSDHKRIKKVWMAARKTRRTSFVKEMGTEERIDTDYCWKNMIIVVKLEKKKETNKVKTKINLM